MTDTAAAPPIETTAEYVDEPPAEPEPLPASRFDFSKPYQSFTGVAGAREFQAFTEGYPDRRAITVYVWRLDPPIDRRQVGNDDSNIQIIAGAFDLDELLERHGSGEYHLKFNDQNLKPAQRAKCTVVLNDPTRPANVNPQELILSGKKGERNGPMVASLVAKGWSIVEKKNELLPEGFKALDAPPAAGDVVTRALADSAAARGGLEKELVAMVREVMGARGGHANDLEQAFKIADRLKPAAPSTDPVLSKLIAVAIERLLSPPAAVSAAAASGDPFEYIEKVSGAFAKMGWVPPGAAAPGPAGIGWAEALAALPGILQHGATFLQQLAYFRMIQNGAVPPAQAAAPAPLPVVAPSALPPTSTPAAAGPSSGGEDVLNPMKLAAMMEVGKLAMQSIESGENGDDFAEKLYMDARYKTLYEDLCEMGAAGIEQTLKLIPGLAEKLEPQRATLEVWLRRFLAYNDPPADEGAAAPVE